MKGNRSSLEDHKKEGKKLTPPLKQIPNLNLTSWMDRLPEYLYAALLTANLTQDEYLKKFRQTVNYFRDSKEEYRPNNLSISCLGKCDDNYLFHSLNRLIDSENLENILRPLLLFKEIPAYSVWKDIIDSEPDNNDWAMLKMTIGKTFLHNSQESTDIRWFIITYQMACGKLNFSYKMKNIAEEIFYYPNKGDLRKVRPTIRAMEINLDEYSGEWTKNFWDVCLSETSPEALLEKPRSNKIDESLTPRLESILLKLTRSFYDTLQTSAVDAKHDATFGFVFYSLQILIDAFNRNVGNYLIGRIILRTLVENYITLAYLIKNDNDELWQEYRAYGAGQAKLVSLKSENYENIPSFISLEEVNRICNEDMLEEFLDIDLGHWANLNLRQMSIKSETKDTYDKYYDWTSGYAHGNWGAVRNSVYATDFNPLHRLMRIPIPTRNYNNVIPDMIEIINLQLKLLTEHYKLKKLEI